MKKLPYTMMGLLAVAVPAALLFWAYGTYQRHVGALNATIKARNVAIDSLEARGARLDAAYTADTAQFARERQGYEAARATLLRQLARRSAPVAPLSSADSAAPPTVTIPLPPDSATVHDFIRSADSTIAACSVVVLTCEQRVAVRQALADSLTVQLKAERSKGRLFGIPLPSREVMFLLGAVAGAAASR